MGVGVGALTKSFCRPPDLRCVKREESEKREVGLEWYRSGFSASGRDGKGQSGVVSARGVTCVGTKRTTVRGESYWLALILWLGLGRGGREQREEQREPSLTKRGEAHAAVTRRASRETRRYYPSIILYENIQ